MMDALFMPSETLAEKGSPQVGIEGRRQVGGPRRSSGEAETGVSVDESRNG